MSEETAEATPANTTHNVELKGQSVEIEMREITSGKSDHKGERSPYLAVNTPLQKIVAIIGEASATKTLASRINGVMQKTWFSDVLQATPAEDQHATFLRSINMALSDTITLKTLQAEAQAIAAQMASLVGDMVEASKVNNQALVLEIMNEQASLAGELELNQQQQAAKARS